MANRRFYQFHNSLIKNLTSIAGVVQFGASGAVGTVSGNGIKGITRLADGIYQIQLQDNYNYFVNGNFTIEASAGGSAVSAGSFVTGTLYQITTLGTTTLAQWQAAGLPVGVTPAVGLPFVAAGVGAGSGTVTPIVDPGIDDIFLVNSEQQMLNNSAAQIAAGGSGAIILFQTVSNGIFAFTGNTTSTSTTISNITSTANLKVGQAISGTGIPLGATVASIVNATSITISAAATATATGVALVADPARLPVNPTSGSVVRFELMLRNTYLTA